jgi:hypothetical protein
MSQDPAVGRHLRPAAPEPAPPAAEPGVRASDADREATVTRLQTAVGEGRIDLDEFGQRASAAYAAATTAELDQLLADLPAPATEVPAVGEIVGERPPSGPVFSVFGDVKLTATTSVPQRVGTLFGDVKIDLRGLRTSAPTVELYLTTVFGDVQVVVSEGVAAENGGWTVFGDRRTELAPVPRLPGTPHVVVRGWSVFGDRKLRSLAPGESPSRWRALLDRLADRRPVVPPPAPPPMPPPPVPPPAQPRF